MAQDVWKWVNDQYVFNSDPDPENGFSGFGGFSYASDGGLGGSQNLLQHLDDYSDGVYRPLAEPAIDRDNAYLPSVKGSSASNPKDSYVEVKCYYNCGTLVPAHWEVQTKTFSNCPDGNGGSSECTPCPVNGITPLTEGKAAINAAIDRLTIPPVPSGTNYYTNIPQGLVWGWRVVSPDTPFTEGADHPADYEPSRAIILLTDGEDNHAVGDAYNNALSNSDLDDKLKAIANNIKAVKDDHGNPVYDIYVIQFTSDGSASTDLLKSIASAKTAPYYFNAPTGDELSDAFEQIGNHLSNLRLSK
jgi:hypothetical protein